MQKKEWQDMRIPSETQLCDEYGVSRVTIRRALAELENEGYVTKKPGKGTFIAMTKIEMYLDQVSSFAQQINQLGLTPSTRMIECRCIEANAHVLERLALAAGSRACYIKRVRCADGVPVMLENTYLPYQRFPGIDQHDFGSEHLYEIMREHYNVNPDSMREHFSATKVGVKDSAYLEIAPNTPVLFVEQYTFSMMEIVEYTESMIRASVYKPYVWVGKYR